MNYNTDILFTKGTLQEPGKTTIKNDTADVAVTAIKDEKAKAGYIANNHVKLIRAGKAYFDLLIELINKATQTIHLQVYIFDDDETGTQVGEALMAAAQRNVQVYLLADGYASQHISASFIKALKTAGVHFKYFSPLFKTKYFYFGRRLHHKVIVTDSSYAMVGGINISNRYNDMPYKNAWLDFAVYTEGAVCKDLCALCWRTWKGFTSSNEPEPCKTTNIKVADRLIESCYIRVRCNDWVRRQNHISRSYLEILKNAERNINILSSYFLPGNLFRKKIAESARRGIKIKVVLAASSDTAIAKHAERYLYRWLLKNNIEIYEYRPNILHGKIAVCDDKWLTIGSYNVNNISAFASIELNLDVKSEPFVKIVNTTIENIIQNDCVLINEVYYNAHHHFLGRLWQKICYEIVRFLFYIFTFYFKQRQ